MAEHKDKTCTAIKFIYPSVDDKQRLQNERECGVTTNFPTHENIVTVKSSMDKKTLDSTTLKTIFSLCPKKVQAEWDDMPKQVKDVGWTCIQMELCGKNLSDWLRQPETTMDSIFIQLKQLQIIQDLISGLKFLHTNKIIHRDLKPGNVMFTSEYKLPIKIGDFGQCRIVPSHDNPTLTGSSIGTRFYTAPEVRSGKYSYQSDLLSLGLIIWEVVALIKPGERSTLFDRLVLDGETHLVAENHPLIGNIADQLVINLTRKKVEERLKNIYDVDKIIDVWKSVQIPEKTLTCRNGEDLELCLRFVSPDSIIILEEGVYEGRFTLFQSNVKIVGKGVGKTEIRTASYFVGNGNDCSVCNLSVHTTNSEGFGLYISGSRNELDSISSNGINVLGDGCRLTNISVNNTTTGIKVNGNDNRINCVKLTNIVHWCIVLEKRSRNCTISDLISENNKRGILVRGEHHTLNGINFANSGEPNNRYLSSVCFEGGGNHTIDKLTCTGYRADTGWNLEIKSSNITVQNCTCFDVLVLGSSVTLSKVNSRDLIRIEGNPKNVELVKCESKKLESKGTLTMTECDFGSVSSKMRLRTGSL